MRDVENPKPSHNRNIPIEKWNKDKLDGIKKDNIYNSLYEGQEIHQPFYTKTYSEVPIIASIKPSHIDSNGFIFTKKVKGDKIVPEVVPALDASEWPDGFKGLDVRPRFFDPISQEYCLVDTGAVVTVVAPGPNDIVRPDLALKAANGSLIECYGYKKSA